MPPSLKGNDPTWLLHHRVREPRKTWGDSSTSCFTKFISCLSLALLYGEVLMNQLKGPNSQIRSGQLAGLWSGTPQTHAGSCSHHTTGHTSTGTLGPHLSSMLLSSPLLGNPFQPRQRPRERCEMRGGVRVPTTGRVRAPDTGHRLPLTEPTEQHWEALEPGLPTDGLPACFAGHRHHMPVDGVSSDKFNSQLTSTSGLPSSLENLEDLATRGLHLRVDEAEGQPPGPAVPGCLRLQQPMCPPILAPPSPTPLSRSLRH